MKRALGLGILTIFCQSIFAQSQILPCQYTKHSFCIQAATFINPANAQRYEKRVQSRTSYRVKVIHHNQRYFVVIGPIPNLSEAKRTAKKLSSHQHPQTRQHTSQQRRWFLTVGGGVAFPSFGHTQLSVANNSGFPSPFNMDAYSVHQNPQPLFTLGLGQRWETANRWLPAYSLGLYYQHFFATNMGNQITQYTAPGFTNYQYNWNLSSDALLIGGKLNILRFYRLQPYVTASLGCALNKSGGYSEWALPGLTDTRVSASYQEKTRAQPVYNIGAGFDLQLSKAFLLSAEYLFQNLGSYSLGHGTASWSSESLDLGTYRANTALINLTYLFE